MTGPRRKREREREAEEWVQTITLYDAMQLSEWLVGIRVNCSCVQNHFRSLFFFETAAEKEKRKEDLTHGKLR